MAKSIWVYSENSDMWPELVKGAKELGSTETSILVIGDQKDAKKASSMSENAYYLGSIGDYMVEDYVETIAKLAKEEQPDGILIGTSLRGRAISGRLASILNITAFSDAKKLELNGGEVVTSHLVYGGTATRINASVGNQFIAVVSQGVFEASSQNNDSPGKITEVPFVEPSWRLKLLSTEIKPPSSINLSASKRVIAVGLGLNKKEDLQIIYDLAKVIDAQVACTRPIAESMEWMPKETYIGISGAMINPELYISVGISGQVQHTVGIEGSKMIITINKDKGCPMVRGSDYTLLGDLYEIIPKLTGSIKNA